MNDLNSVSLSNAALEEIVYATISRVASTLGVKVERTEIDLESITSDDSAIDAAAYMQLAGKQIGIAVNEASFENLRDIFELVSEGFPVIICEFSGNCRLLRQTVGKKIEVADIRPGEFSSAVMTRGELKRYLANNPEVTFLVAKKELECDAISSAPIHELTNYDGKPLSPFKRFVGLLQMDAVDITTVALFAMVAGILSLATPLAVESLVNVVSWGIYLQPLFMLAVILLTCLGISAALSILQTLVVEVIQRRQLVRIVSDLAHRFPRANQQYLEGKFPRELANRVFDIMTIQKATAILLLDGMSIVLTTFLGLLLLAFYHPFLLGFDIVLVISMTVITWVLGRGGIKTAIKESKTKYRIVHWLQDVLDSPAAFRINGGEALAIDRASRLATEYVEARKSQFRVVLRQIIFAVGLQVIASTALLGLGGWLVIQGQLTLGQLVASELVVTVVVGAFSKAGKSLEKYYDMMAGIDKVGQLLDIPVDEDQEVSFATDGALPMTWDDLKVRDGVTNIFIEKQTVQAGTLTAIQSSKSMSPLMEALVGLRTPVSGVVEVGGYDVTRLSVGCQQGQIIGYASKPKIFHGTVADNVGLGRIGVGKGRIRELMQQLGLWDEIIRLQNGLDTNIASDGYPLSEVQLIKMMFARAIAGRPRILVIDGLLDDLEAKDRETVISFLKSHESDCTTILKTQLDEVAAECSQIIKVD